jgi:MFS transporter, ACDE family, multidrug resistance protein
MTPTDDTSLLRQPKAVWAVAFACVVAFMGIGLVDPILPAIASQLDASPSQVELLFTSYFAVTGVAMLITGFVSSRIGPKRTLLAGLALVVIFSVLAGASGSVTEIVGFRAGWGLGNALFIATALSVIIGSASGGVGGAIILYEAALGLGIASGPLLGGLLGGISWRGPFFGTAALMAVGFVAIVTLLDRVPAPARRMSIAEPLLALRHPGLRTAAVVAVLYNFGFFTLLAYTPFPLGLGAHQLGLIFFGWGLLLAVSSVWAAPPLQRRFGLVGALAGGLTLVALDLVVLGLGTGTRAVLIVGVIVAGAFLGVVNTILTEAVMKVSPVERPIASAAYSFVRFTGGAIAPFLAGKLAEHIGASVPFYVGAGAVTAAVAVLLARRGTLRAAEQPPAVELAVGPAPEAAPAPVLLAVDASPAAAVVTAAAAQAALARHSAVRVVHVRETDVVGDAAADVETAAAAAGALRDRLAELDAFGVRASGEVVHTVGDHDDAAAAVLDRLARSGAGLLVVGAPARHGGRLGHSLADAARERAGDDVDVLVVAPGTPTRAT